MRLGYPAADARLASAARVVQAELGKAGIQVDLVADGIQPLVAAVVDGKSRSRAGHRSGGAATTGWPPRPPTAAPTPPPRPLRPVGGTSPGTAPRPSSRSLTRLGLRSRTGGSRSTVGGGSTRSADRPAGGHRRRVTGLAGGRQRGRSGLDLFRAVRRRGQLALSLAGEGPDCRSRATAVGARQVAGRRHLPGGPPFRARRRRKSAADRRSARQNLPDPAMVGRSARRCVIGVTRRAVRTSPARLFCFAIHTRLTVTLWSRIAFSDGPRGYSVP